MKELTKKSYAVKFDYNPFNNVLRSGSPSMDYIYANTHGLPFGYSEVLWGGSKNGKSIITNAKIGQLHQQDPEAIVIKFNTEHREKLQMTPRAMRQWGIDPDRYIVYETNRPDEIFDPIGTGDILDALQKGAPIKYIVIDSSSDIMGRRTLNADTVMTQQIGDEAKTLQDGFKLIKPVIREFNIALTVVAQARAELDPVEQMRGKKEKMHAAYALKHFAEYFIHVERVATKKDDKDVEGNEFYDLSKKDMSGKAERMAHKIKVTMDASSCGPAGRVGMFTLDYYNGFINTYEEAFLLGIGQNVIKKPTQQSYMIPDFPVPGESQTYRGKPGLIQALKENKPLTDEIVRRVRLLDIEAMEKGRTPFSGVSEATIEETISELEEE